MNKQTILRPFELLNEWNVPVFLVTTGLLLLLFGVINLGGLPAYLIAVGGGMVGWGVSLKKTRNKVWNPLTGYYEDREEEVVNGEKAP